jgi:hypothetical protein
MHLAALSVSLFSWIFSPSLPETCPPLETAVSVYSSSHGHTIDHSKTRSELGALMGGKVLTGFHAQGLTDVTYSTAPRYTIVSHKLSDGRWCAALQSVSIEFGLGEPARVHIAKEIPEGSCRYDTVLVHEMQHVSISQRAIELAVDDLRETLRSSLGSVSPAYGISEEAASDVLKASLQKLVTRVTRKHIDKAEFDNAAIDTRLSYETLTNQCPGSPH